MRRRKVTYPPPKTATKSARPGAGDPRLSRDSVVSIDPAARLGRGTHRIGDRVRILSGLFSGETAVIEGLAGGVIPAALVRTEAGRTRRVRTIDVEPA